MVPRNQSAVKMADIEPIRTEADHETALARIDELMDAEPGSPEGRELDVLVGLVNLYESWHEPMGWPDPVAAIEFRMEQAGLRPHDLIPFSGRRLNLAVAVDAPQGDLSVSRQTKMTRRAEVLRAISEAATVFAESPSGTRTSFDIIGAVAERNIPLLFRPLDKLWGAFISVNDEERGIIVTTKLGLPVQRFTLAHELGHLLLGHQTSLDETIEFAGRNAPASRPPQEAAADTFASELLAPKRLLLASAKRHGWTRDKLHQPGNIYQLSLRLGISYQAACWALVTSDVLTRQEAARLQTTSVKDLKRALAPTGSITNSWADVWALTAADSETFLEAGSDDLIAVHVQDHASAGYVGRLVDANAETEIVDERSPDLEQAYGARSGRVLHVRFRAPGVHHLVFEHIRPWNRATLARIEIDIDGHGKERGGWARRTKCEALEQVA